MFDGNFDIYLTLTGKKQTAHPNSWYHAQQTKNCQNPYSSPCVLRRQLVPASLSIAHKNAICYSFLFLFVCRFCDSATLLCCIWPSEGKKKTKRTFAYIYKSNGWNVPFEILTEKKGRVSSDFSNISTGLITVSINRTVESDANWRILFESNLFFLLILFPFVRKMCCFCVWNDLFWENKRKKKICTQPIVSELEEYYLFNQWVWCMLQIANAQVSYVPCPCFPSVATSWCFSFFCAP